MWMGEKKEKEKKNNYLSISCTFDLSIFCSLIHMYICVFEQDSTDLVFSVHSGKGGKKKSSKGGVRKSSRRVKKAIISDITDTDDLISQPEYNSSTDASLCRSFIVLNFVSHLSVRWDFRGGGGVRTKTESWLMYVWSIVLWQGMYQSWII